MSVASGGRGVARRAVLLAVLAAAPALACGEDEEPVSDTLRVCADPNNLPFSNDRLEGFENELAALVAEELDAAVEYTWRAQRRGFLRNTLGAGRCDALMGIPTSVDRVATTRPYYRSSYVLVQRADADVRARSLADPALRELRIGVPLVGDDGANPPPVHAATRRGIEENLRGYLVYGDYSEPNPPARLIEAVALGEVDVAIAWGPRAAYFARRQSEELTVTPVSSTTDAPSTRMEFDVSMGVAPGDTALLEALDEVIRTRRSGIDSLLDAYAVPRVGGAGGAPDADR